MQKQFKCNNLKVQPFLNDVELESCDADILNAKVALNPLSHQCRSLDHCQFLCILLVQLIIMLKYSAVTFATINCEKYTENAHRKFTSALDEFTVTARLS